MYSATNNLGAFLGDTRQMTTLAALAATFGGYMLARRSGTKMGYSLLAGLGLGSLVGAGLFVATEAPV